MTDDEVADKAFELAAEGGDEGRALFLILYITMEDKEAGPYLMEYVLPKMPRDDQTRIKF